MRASLMFAILATAGAAVTSFASEMDGVALPLSVAPPKGVMQVKVDAQSQRLTSFGIETDRPLDAVGLIGGATQETASGIAVYENGAYTLYLKGEDGLWYIDLNADPVDLDIKAGQAFYIQNRAVSDSLIYFTGAPLTADPGQLQISSGMQLIGPMHTSSVDINKAQLLESGALSSELMDGTSASLNIVAPYSADLWLSHDGWKDSEAITSLLSTDKMLLGRGYWLNSVNPDGFLWSMNRAYSHPFSDTVKPTVTQVVVDSATSLATLTIDSAGVNSVIVLSQNVGENGSYDPMNWEVASGTLNTGGSSVFSWSDTLEPSESDAASFRFWVAVDATQDSDNDGICDHVELLVTHTSVNSADSDADGRSDYDEVYSDGSNPLAVDPMPQSSVDVNLVKGLVPMAHGSLSGISADRWQRVELGSAYASPVIVTTPEYTKAHAPVVLRLRNVTGNSFEIKAECVNPSATAVSPVDATFFIVEEGIYTLEDHGVAMEAVKYDSSVTDNKWRLS